jgi:hypothetical protein
MIALLTDHLKLINPLIGCQYLAESVRAAVAVGATGRPAPAAVALVVFIAVSFSLAVHPAEVLVARVSRIIAVRLRRVYVKPP